MEKLLPHIERLLACNDHVIVPGLGVFAVQKSSAVIRGSYILPPRASLGFNPMVHHNDGLLPLEISRALHLSYREASRMIDEEVRLFLEDINEEEAEDFGNLGSFILDHEGHLQFTPNNHLPFLPMNFGQRAVRLPAPVTINHRVIEMNFPAFRILRYAAAAVFIFALLYSSGVNNTATLHDQANLNMFQSFNWEELSDQSVEEPSLEVNAEKPVNQLDYPDSTESATSIEVVSENAPYSVVVGVFKTSVTAQRMADDIITEFPATAVSAEGDYYKVTLCHFTTISEAIHYMEVLRSKDPRFADAWVLKN